MGVLLLPRHDSPWQQLLQSMWLKFIVIPGRLFSCQGYEIFIVCQKLENLQGDPPFLGHGLGKVGWVGSLTCTFGEHSWLTGLNYNYLLIRHDSATSHTGMH